MVAADMVNHAVHPANCNAVLDLTSEASSHNAAGSSGARMQRIFVLRAGKQQ